MRQSAKCNLSSAAPQESELIYDYAWYAGMLASDPASCCFAATCRVRAGERCMHAADSPRPCISHLLRQSDRSSSAVPCCCTVWVHDDWQGHPIHLWDAYTAELRCTYRIYDAKDEVRGGLLLEVQPAFACSAALHAAASPILDVPGFERRSSFP